MTAIRVGAQHDRAGATAIRVGTQHDPPGRKPPVPAVNASP
ncbi:hypothetical protein ACWIFK_14315 [Streptomyces althioticus]